MNFDSGHRARQGQHNKRGRGRNNRRPGGGGGGGSHNNGGGNSANRVYESNGPDVKVRGTAQTVAEKYMQLGRDAQSSGDNVMAESYFQFSEHYFRVMAAAQPVGQPTTQLRRPEDEDFEEEGGDAAEGETDTAQAAMVSEGGQPGTGEQADSGGEPRRKFRQQRDNRDGNRERFRPRWQNRGDQPRDGDSEPRWPSLNRKWPGKQPLRRAPVAMSRTQIRASGRLRHSSAVRLPSRWRKTGAERRAAIRAAPGL